MIQKLQSSGLQVEQESITPIPGLLERLDLTERLPLALVFGCLLGLSSPGFDLWWLAWFGLAPLLVLIAGCRGKLEATITGLVFGMGYNLVGLRWLLGLYPLNWMGMADWLGFQAAAAVWLVESLHQSLLLLGFALLTFMLPMRAGFAPFYNRPFYPYLLSVPLIWIFFQWILGTSEPFLGTPVNQLAYSQYQQLPFIQLAKLGGSQLIDFILLMFNAAVAAIIIDISGWVPRPASRIDTLSPRSGAFVDLSCLVLLLILVAWWGQGEVNQMAIDTNLCPPEELWLRRPPVAVAVLQGNVSIEAERLGSFTPSEISKRYALLGSNLGVALIVLPEGVISLSQGEPGLLLSQIEHIAAAEKKEILTGQVDHTSAGYVNVARLISPIVYQNNFYIKRRLVPFGEFIPAGPLAAFIPEPVRKLLSGGSESFIASRSLSLLECLWGKIGSSICSEVIYPRLISSEVRQGASLLVNISNLAWFHNSTLNRQILAAAIFRAIENGRYMVLATNTGISAVIDPSGLVTSSSLPAQKGVLVDTVQFLYCKTPFTKMWWL